MSLNRVHLIGNLGADPELRTTAQGISVANFSIATTESYMQEGRNIQKTEWHRIVVWGKVAENCQKFLKKGSRCFVEGKIQHRSYDKDGVKYHTTEIIAHGVQFLDSKKDAEKPAEHKYTIADDFDNMPF